MSRKSRRLGRPNHNFCDPATRRDKEFAGSIRETANSSSRSQDRSLRASENDARLEEVPLSELDLRRRELFSIA